MMHDLVSHGVVVLRASQVGLVQDIKLMKMASQVGASRIKAAQADAHMHKTQQSMLSIVDDFFVSMSRCKKPKPACWILQVTSQL